MQLEICAKFVSGGAELKLIAVEVGTDEWELVIENTARIRTIWLEIFNSPEAALAAGKTAIEVEGIEEFTSTEGFGYLNPIGSPGLVN